MRTRCLRTTDGRIRRSSIGKGNDRAATGSLTWRVGSSIMADSICTKTLPRDIQILEGVCFVGSQSHVRRMEGSPLTVSLCLAFFAPNRILPIRRNCQSKYEPISTWRRQLGSCSSSQLLYYIESTLPAKPSHVNHRKKKETRKNQNVEIGIRSKPCGVPSTIQCVCTGLFSLRITTVLAR